MSSEKLQPSAPCSSDGSASVGDDRYASFVSASGRRFSLRPGSGSAALEWLRNLPEDERPKTIPDHMEIYNLPRDPENTHGVSPEAIATEVRLSRIAKLHGLADRVVVRATSTRAHD